MTQAVLTFTQPGKLACAYAVAHAKCSALGKWPTTLVHKPKTSTPITLPASIGQMYIWSNVHMHTQMNRFRPSDCIHSLPRLCYGEETIYGDVPSFVHFCCIDTTILMQSNNEIPCTCMYTSLCPPSNSLWIARLMISDKHRDWLVCSTVGWLTGTSKSVRIIPVW